MPLAGVAAAVLHMAFSSYSTGTKGLLQLAAIWGVTAVAVVFAIGHFDEIRTALGLKLSAEDFGVHAAAAPKTGTKKAESTGEKTITIAANSSGHFETNAQVNGRTIHVMVDTGATMVALSHEDAATAGIHPSQSEYSHRVSTANGTARVAPILLDEVSIGDIVVRDVRAVVAERGRLTTSLLGMSFLSQLTKTEISRGVLTLQD